MACSFEPKLHHELGIHHLLTNERAALWAGCGLGKTAMTLAAVNELFQRWDTKGVLVIAPLRVCVLTWPAEVRKWGEFSWMRLANLRTKEGWQALLNGSAHVYVINWDALPKLVNGYCHNRRAVNFAFDTVVFDELTRAKNHESKRVNALRPYLPRVRRRWGLTGTPAPNGLLDVFAQIRLLDDGKRFGPSFNTFREGYFFPVDRYTEYNWALKDGAEEKIHRKVSDIALVLRSSDFLDVPDTIVHDVDVPFPDCARKHYKELADELLTVTEDDKEISAVNAAVLVNKLLQVTGGAAYLTEEFDDDGKPLPKKVVQLHDAKVKALKALAKKLAPERLLIACQYQHEQSRIVAALPGAVRFDSAKTDKAQRELEDRWNAGKIPYLVANPQSIGHGLNLQQGGRITVWFSHTWSRELYDQLNARLARTGQTKVPEIYRLVCPGTMDDAVIETLREKGDTQSALLQAVKNFRQLHLLG